MRRQERAIAAATPRPLSFYGLLTVVLISPLPIGAVSQWAWASLALAVAALLCLWAWEVLRGASLPDFGPLRGPLLIFAAVLSWAAVQAWSGTPASLHNPIWAEVRAVLGVPVAGAISVNPTATVHGMIRLATYAAIVFLAFVHCRDAARARIAVAATAVAATAYAGYGLVVFLGGFETILWFPKTAYIGDLTGPLVNRNSFATYCDLGLLCLAALMTRDLARSAGPGAPWRERMRAHLEASSNRGLLYVAGLAIVGTALLLTHSRGGLLAAAISLLVFAALIAARSAATPRRTVLASTLGAAVVFLLLATSGETTLIRLADAKIEAEPRVAAYERTLAALADSPYLGTGLGTFRDIFQLYRTPEIERPFFQAHNTYLENALELGIPAAIGLTGAVAWLGLACFRGALRRRRRATYPCLGFAATVLVGTHALVDFSLQIPAVAALYFLILGIGVGQARSSREL